MIKQMRVIRTERIWLKPTTRLRHLCHISKNLFNEANYLVRHTLGLFKSQQGTIINADVNGVYNILKKAFLNVLEADRIEAVGLHPTRWRLAPVTNLLMTSCE